MKNNLKLLLVACLALCVLLVSCANRGPGKNLIDREEPAQFKPTPDVDVDPELLKKYQTHKENAPLAFTTYENNPAEDFEYSITDGGVIIENYIGEGDIVLIPDTIEGVSVHTLEKTSFAGKDVRAVYVPDSVKIIRKGAFEDCKSLSTLRIPFIGNGEGDNNGGVIFGSDEYISNGLKVPGSLKMLIVGEGVSEVCANSLSYFKSLEAIILPSSLKKIGQFAFNECRSLVYVDLGGVKYIEEYAFLCAESLISLDVPDTTLEISLGAFMECESLKYISLPFVGGSNAENRYIGYIFGAEDPAWNGDFVPAMLSYVTVRSENVPNAAFEGCINLIEVTLENGVETVGERAFANCKSMQSVIVADSVQNIGADAFINCYTLESVVISTNAKLSSIGVQSFMNCRSLKTVRLPMTITEIPAGAFWGCAALETVDAVRITSVGANAFRGCESLSHVTGITVGGIHATGNTNLRILLG